MKIVAKFDLVLLGICIVFLISGIILITQTMDLTKKTIITNYQVRTKILANSVDHTIHEKISSFTRFQEKSALPHIKSSNEEFSKIDNVGEYIKQIDGEWNSQNSQAITVTQNDLSDILVDQALYYNNAWSFSANREHESFIKEIIMTNSYGAVVAASNKPSDYQQDDEKWWIEARSTGYFIDDIYYDESSKSEAIAISLAINDDDGNFVGVAKYVLDPLAIAYPLNDATSISKYNTTKYYLFTHDGKTIHSNYYTVGHSVASEGFFDKINNSEGNVDTELSDGTKILLVYAKTANLVSDHNLNWIIGISIDDREIMDQTMPLINLVSLFLVIIFMLVVVTMFVISRAFHNQLVNIQKIANRIGNGNLEVNSQITGNDEFAEISGYFENIRRSIKHQLETIRQNEFQIKIHLDHVKNLIRQKDEFVSLVAHELKTPLVPILGHIELLKETSAFNDEQLDSMNEITQSAQRIESLIEDLLTAQKLDLGKLKVRKTKFKVNSLLLDIYQKFAFVTKKKNIQFTIKDDTNDAILESDFQRLTEVLSNLLLNSFDFVAPNKGTISIIAFLSDDAVVISVTDNGVGISKEHLSKLFTKFYQVDSSIKRRHGGTGLGLVICKGIMELLGGSIKITSEQNVGTTVSITLALGQKKTTGDSESKSVPQLSNVGLPFMQISQMRDRDHLAFEYEHNLDLGKILSEFIRNGMQNQLLNLLIISKEEKMQYVDLLKQNGVDVDEYFKSNDLIVCEHDELYPDGEIGSSFQSILNYLNDASYALKKNGKRGFNIVGTVAGNLANFAKHEKCVDIEKSWHYVLPTFKYPIRLICPYKTNLPISIIADLSKYHTAAYLGNTQ